ncbi:glycosyltransferase [uncultured Sulfitobacter sp.]|uniref:glycosyltransferase family protein n=1 Tax=uncultured Sulfitobacter sp. TaxID=191468 RepID=UPI002615A742|nr:glycosyltransferase [uncultured Sulfitobacter sp.]
MKVMIVVTHLLGTGHLARALTLARAFGAKGNKAVVVSGGMAAPHLSMADVQVEQLPPVRSDGVDFSVLLDEKRQQVSALYMRDRQRFLLSILERMAPDVLITELFPFGRRILKDEFSALLDAANAQTSRPLIACSIRDILAPPSKPAKAALADAFVANSYDAVLVHADPNLTPLNISWPVSPALQSKLHYTGFVAPPPAQPHPDAVGHGEIIVSAGGGDVGGHIFAAALDAARLGDRRWRLLLGGAGAEARAVAMQAQAPRNVIIEPARPDFRQMLYHAEASISMCGYNTALDVLQSGVNAVFVPFDAGSEVEQGLRAQALAAQPGIAVLRASELTGPQLLRTLDDLDGEPRRAPLQANMDGAAQSVKIVDELWRGQHAD